MPQLTPSYREIFDAYSRRLSVMRAEIDAMQQDMDRWADSIDPHQTPQMELELETAA